MGVPTNGKIIVYHSICDCVMLNSYIKKASEEIRTLDLLDGNQMLYQLSYTRE